MFSSLQYNPPFYVPAVEVVPSIHTSEAVLQKTLDLLKELGKAPVLVKKELNGFALNRLQYAIIMEAWRLVEVCILYMCTFLIFFDQISHYKVCQKHPPPRPFIANINLYTLLISS